MNSLKNIQTNVIFVAFCSLALGFFLSISLISLFQILIFVPFFISFIKNKKLPTVQLVLLLLILQMLLSNIFNSLFSPLESYTKLSLWILIWLSYYGFQYLNEKGFFTNKRKKTLLNLLIGAAIIATIYGYFKYFLHFDLVKWIEVFPQDRRIGGFSGIMRYGYGLGALITSAVCYFIYAKKNEIMIPNLIIFCVCFIFIGFYLSYTRGAILGMLLAIPIGLYYYHKKISIIVALISFIIVSILTFIALTGGSKQSRFMLNAQSGTNIKRLSQYHAGVIAAKENPWIGLGTDQFSYHVADIKKKHKLKRPDYISHTHNIFIEIAANSGLAALILFLSWLSLWIKHLCYSTEFNFVVILPTLVSFLIGGLFEQVINGHLTFILFTLYGITYARTNTQN